MIGLEQRALEEQTAGRPAVRGFAPPAGVANRLAAQCAADDRQRMEITSAPPRYIATSIESTLQ
jgi:hypothetical protein